MESPVVQIPDGKIKGTQLTDMNGEKFHAFLSIPYGKPPIGDLRFKPPEPVEPWEGVKDASKQGDVSIQLNPRTKQFIGSEDCLNLHVFTKKLPSEEQELKPVIYWIHGGGFVQGTHDIEVTGPNYLITKDVVLVHVTYRLGLLGFLSLQDTSLDVPGNAGLKDQVLGLKWVQKNIKFFNGDPDNVTIVGMSAGGASVEYLFLSPSAKNLFHKAIAMSGSTLNPWARSTFFNPLDFGKHLGHSNLNEKQLLKLLTEMSAQDLHLAQLKYSNEVLKLPLGLITPVIEKPNPTALITKNPIDIMQAGEQNQVPYMVGFSSKEGFLWEILDRMAKMMGLSPAEEDPNKKNMLPSDTNFKDDEVVKKINAKLNEFYGNEKYKKIDLLTDSMFAIGILVSAINVAKSSKHPVYVYKFVYEGAANMVKNSFQVTETIGGSCHGDDMGYLFSAACTPKTLGQTERLTIKRMITMFTNFAKYGDPTPKDNDLYVEWEPVQSGNLNFLEIGSVLVPGKNLYKENLKRWKEIFQLNPVTAKYMK